MRSEKEILEQSKRIAVVGASSNVSTPAYKVPKYVKEHGYTIIPVNPYETEVLGEKAYPTLDAVPGDVDIVNVFRRHEALPGVVEAAIAKGAKVVWMQKGVYHQEAASRARAAGLEVIMDRCIECALRELKEQHPNP